MAFSAIPYGWQKPDHSYLNSYAELQSLSDCDLLGLLIELMTAKCNGRAIAVDLFSHFGSLSEVLKAKKSSFPNKINDEKILDIINILQAIFTRALHSSLVQRPLIKDLDDLYNYLHASMDSLVSEQVRIIFLNKAKSVITEEIVSLGTINCAPVFPREIVRRSLELGASSIIIVHNHPSGIIQPSSQDISVTRKIIEAGRIFDISVVDHIIIGREGHFSLRSNGLI